MNAGILFYLARKTSLCQKQLSHYLQYYGVNAASVKICAKQTGLSPAMAVLLEKHPVVFVVSGGTEARPCAANPIFETLHIPLDAHGEPKRVLRLTGRDMSGYLIESLNQAIVLLPDHPEELNAMLPQACDRLKLKFGLHGEPPPENDTDYKALVAESMEAHRFKAGR